MVEYQVKKVERKTIYCPECRGQREIEEKEYHNKYVKIRCPTCKGKGEIDKIWEEWVSLEYALEKIKKLRARKKMSE